MRYDKISSLLCAMAEDIQYPVKCFRLAAAVLYKRNVVSFGTNSYKTDPFQSRYRKNPNAIFLHAEVAAIKNALKRIEVTDLKWCELMVVRVKRNDKNTKFIPAMAKPCSGCERCLAEFGIKRILYTSEDGTLKEH